MISAVLGTEHGVALLPAETIRARMAGLRSATAAQHDAVERLLSVEERLTSVGLYRALLARFYGLYLPLEAQISRVFRDTNLPLDLEARQKAPLLARDLAALGVAPETIARLPTCDALPNLSSTVRGLGSLYVLEGATLGGKVIERHLKRALGVTTADGGAFFGCYGREVGVRWQAFCSVLAASLDGRAREREIVDAASETFSVFGRWLEAAPSPGASLEP